MTLQISIYSNIESQIIFDNWVQLQRYFNVIDLEPHLNPTLSIQKHKNPRGPLQSL